MKQALCLLLVGLSSCTIIEVKSEGQEARIERTFGLTRLQLWPKSAPIVAKIKSFGFLDSPLGATLGYSEQVMAILPPSCRVVFWVESQEQFDRIKAVVDIEDICPVVMEKEKRQ